MSFQKLLLLFSCITALSLAANSQIQGNQHPVEGTTETYTYSGTPPPGTYTYVVTHGTVVASNTNPANGILYAQIRWDFNQSTGQMKAIHNASGTSYSYNVSIHDIEDELYCLNINPANQQVAYGANPAELFVANCDLYDLSNYVIQYYWEKADYFPNTTLSWSVVFNQPNESYQPVSMLQYGSIAYRRVMNIYDNSGINLLRTVYTNIAIVTLSGPFQPGTISDPGMNPNNPTDPVLVSLNTVLSISQTPASGGLCYQNTYTWERSVSGGPWETIGTAEQYPFGAPVIKANCRIRRKVVCGTSVAYSNTLYYQLNYSSPNLENLNYLRELTVLRKGVESWEESDNLPTGDKLQATTYVDGLGRTIQSVQREASPSANNTWKDLVTHYEYDAAGRSPKTFLPYATFDNPGKFKTNAAAAQPIYIQGFFGEPSTAPTYSLTEYDNSPLNRVTKVTAPGQSWINTGTSTIPDFNDASEKVHIWTLDYLSTAIPVTSPSAIYPTGQLSKSTTTDVQGNKVIVYSDRSGQVILRKVQQETGGSLSDEHSGWVCTYYIYDDFGRERYVITPKAIQYLDNNNWNLTQDIVNDLCFSSLYDQKGRLIVNKKPGAGEQVLVYDKKDRIILSQDARQKLSNQWCFKLYDNLDREVANGLFENNISRAAMQSYVDNSLNNGPVTNNVFVGNGTYQNIEVDNPIAGNTGSSSYCNGCNASTLTYNAVTHYDGYGYSGAKSFNTNNSFAYTAGTDPGIEATVKTDRVKGAVTGEKIRVLDSDNNPLNDKFLFSTAYYDEQGRALQDLSDNIKNASDYQTTQYKFSGQVASSFMSHNNGTTVYTVISKHEYDKIGRMTRLSRNFNNTFYKELAEYAYDELGQLKTTRLAPGYNGSEIEKLTYDYNIHGWLTGINKDYVLSDNNYTQWDRYFGMYLGYDNRDGKFTSALLNGNITGTIWRSQGDNSPRKYDYQYDRLDRFQTALFKQKNRPSENWLSTEVDFSTYMEYEDGNGNIKSMKHMGVIPGTSTPVIVDDLGYTYKPVNGMTSLNGNKLGKVTDMSILGTTNGLLGDFKDESPSLPGDDYEYDITGSLLKDLNKGIGDINNNGVTYNFLGKPARIVTGSKWTNFTYDASGSKISKEVGLVGNSTGITTWYIGDFIYEENNLQFVLHEEGRLKIITPHTKVNDIDYDLNAGFGGITWPGNQQGVFEYFIKDHLGSTRMVLTEEVQKEYYKATMEQSASAVENPLFGRVNPNGTIPGTNELEQNRVVLNNCATPTPWPGNCTDMVKLSGVDNHTRIGPNMILKVMAGDVISGFVNYYYVNDDNSSDRGNIGANAINSLFEAINSPGKGNVIGKSESININNSLLSNVLLDNFFNGQAQSPSLSPKAHLNIIFLDEQFKYVENDLTTPGIGSNSAQVDQAGIPSAYKALQQKAPKNGWVFVYLSNFSYENVYFDNFIVTQEHSRISEENHYYPYGLKIAGISSKAFNKLGNKHNYQGNYSEEESETGWNEFDLRMYDPQIGRWTAVDPFDELHTPYAGMDNNPISLTDPTGGSTLSPPDWLKNRHTGQYEWFDDVNSLKDYFNSKYVKDYVYPYDKERGFEIAKGDFIDWYGGRQQFFHRNGAIEPLQPLENVIVVGTRQPPSALDSKIISLDNIKANKWQYDGNDSFGEKAGKFLGNVFVSIYNNAVVGTAEQALNPHLSPLNLATPHNLKRTVNSLNYISSHTLGDMTDDLVMFVGDKVSDINTYEDFVGALATRRFTRGQNFTDYKISRGGGSLVGEITLNNRHPYYGYQFPVRVEYSHRWITQATQRKYKLPNFIVNNRLNVLKTNTLRHAQHDPWRYRFLPKEIKYRLESGDLRFDMFD